MTTRRCAPTPLPLGIVCFVCQIRIRKILDRFNKNKKAIFAALREVCKRHKRAIIAWKSQVQCCYYASATHCKYLSSLSSSADQIS